VFIIDDLRFPSEFALLRKSGHRLISVKIDREHTLVQADFHSSEQGLSDEEFDFVIYNDFDTVDDYVGYTLQVITPGFLNGGTTSS
jgi:hypothetical protein